MEGQIAGTRAVNKAIHAMLLQVDFLSDCGLDLCLAITSHKRVQLLASSTWRDDLKDTIRKAVNHQADLEEHNISLDMFVEMKSETKQRVDQANQTDTSAAPFSPLHNAVPEKQTASSCVIEESIKIEPADADQVFISQTEDRSYIEGDDPPDSVTPSHDLAHKRQICESYVIEEESFDAKPAVVEEMFNLEENSSCTEEGDLVNHLKVSQPSSVFKTVSPREYTSARSDGQAEAHTYEQPEICGNAFTRVDADTPEKTLNSNLSNIASIASSSSLRSRIRNHVTVKVHHCNCCEYKSTRKCNLITHMRKHTGETFNCDKCEYKCTRSDQLRSHMRKHSGETFNCKHCDYKSTRKHQLIVHTRKHTGETFNCDQCDYRSNFKNGLVAHLRKHTGETFNCGQCDYRSFLKSNLSTHITSRHTGETFNCEHCNFKYTRKGHLQSHIKHRHSGSDN